ncbi:CDK-activating kinase assembly factor MAT1-like isoform X2 [Convolutriloba macropyga]|uniref:CDK-activating kinase assembly factor MAT1-like isoform X2 n=1 Tax=Convolutriloba macropyga TaxID=536237 RepID=UPI003F521818
MDDNDIMCPNCGSTKYRNPNMRLFIGTCGHSYCENCMNAYFSRGAHPCYECKTNLNHSSFRLQVFDDAAVDKEVEVRRKLTKELNLYEEDFSSLREYNDFLENFEEIVFNFTSNIDIIATKSKLDSMKEQYSSILAQNRFKKLSKDQEQIRKQIQKEREILDQMQQKVAMETMYMNQAKRSNKMNLLKKLETSSLPAEQIVNEHQKDVSLLNRQGGVEVSENSAVLEENAFDELEICYEYTSPQLDIYGPDIPMDTEIVTNDPPIFKFVFKPSEIGLAGGYHQSLACNRAISDAFNCLFY